MLDKLPNSYEQLIKIANATPKVPEALKSIEPFLKAAPINPNYFPPVNTISKTSDFIKDSLNMNCDENCDMLEICKEVGCTYKACYKGAAFASRCKASDRQAIVQQLQLTKLQKSMIDLQNKMLENQKVEEEKHENEVAERESSDKQNRKFNWITFGVATFLTIVVLIFTIISCFKP
jgi:hypothetical protein